MISREPLNRSTWNFTYLLPTHRSMWRKKFELPAHPERAPQAIEFSSWFLWFEQMNVHIEMPISQRPLNLSERNFLGIKPSHRGMCRKKIELPVLPWEAPQVIEFSAWFINLLRFEQMSWTVLFSPFFFACMRSHEPNGHIDAKNPRVPYIGKAPEREICHFWPKMAIFIFLTYSTVILVPFFCLHMLTRTQRAHWCKKTHVCHI